MGCNCLGSCRAAAVTLIVSVDKKPGRLDVDLGEVVLMEISTLVGKGGLKYTYLGLFYQDRTECPSARPHLLLEQGRLGSLNCLC
jgi:hypothetical protein